MVSAPAAAVCPCTMSALSPSHPRRDAMSIESLGIGAKRRSGLAVGRARSPSRPAATPGRSYRHTKWILDRAAADRVSPPHARSADREARCAALRCKARSARFGASIAHTNTETMARSL